MNLKKIAIWIVAFAQIQGLIEASNAGANALIRQIGASTVPSNFASVAPSLIQQTRNQSFIGNPNKYYSKNVNMPKIFNSTPSIGEQQEMLKQESTVFPQAENITPSRYQNFMGNMGKYKDSMKNNAQRAVDFARKVSKTRIYPQSPIKIHIHPDLSIKNLFQDKMISFSAFVKAMTALAAAAGFYILYDYLDYSWENGNTFLMWAVREDNEHVVGFLLDLGVDINTQNQDGDTAMHFAVREGNAKMVELLINKIKEKYEDDPQKAKEEVAKLLNTKNKQGRTVLLDAVEYESLVKRAGLVDRINQTKPSIVDLCLDNGADLFVKNKAGDTVMLIAARDGNAKIIQSCIDKIKEKYKNDPKKAQQEVAKLLNTQNNAGQTVLLDVVKNGQFLKETESADSIENARLYILKLCIENGANLSAQNSDGNNVLFLLAQKMKSMPNEKDTYILRELFDEFAKKDPRALQALNNTGDTLLLQAVGDNNLYLFNYLKNKTISILDQNKMGQNIIIKAVLSKNINMLKDVLDLVTNKFKDDSLGATVLDKEGNPDLKDLWTMESLKHPWLTLESSLGEIKDVFWSKKESNKQILEQLTFPTIKDILSIKDNKGKTALDYAIYENYSLPFVELLVDNGAQINTSQFLYSLNRKNYEVLKFLLSKNVITQDLKMPFLQQQLVVSLKQQDDKMFNMLLPLVDQNVKQQIIPDVVNTGNQAIMQDFLKSSNITDTIRKQLLKEAVRSDASEETIRTLVNDPQSQNAYRKDESFRSSVLQEAMKHTNISNVSSIMGTKSSVNLNSLQEKNPNFKVLTVGLQPKQPEGGIFTTISDKMQSLIGSPTSEEQFKKEEQSFKQDVEKIIREDEIYRNKLKRSSILENFNKNWGKDTEKQNVNLKADKKEGWGKRFAVLFDAEEKALLEELA